MLERHFDGEVGGQFSAPPCVILAGGKSSRMGQDKALLNIKDLRLIDHVFQSLRSQWADIIISAPHNYGLPCRAIPDLGHAPKGPLAALYSVWTCLYTYELAASDKKGRSMQGFYTVSVDVPHVPSSMREQLGGDGPARYMEGDNIHPTLAYWPMEGLTQFFHDKTAAELLKIPRSLNTFGNMMKVRNVAVPDGFVLFNINTPNDYDSYLTHISQADSGR